MSVSTFLVISAVLYGIFGLGALLVPAQVFAPMGYSLNETAMVLSRAGAAATIGIAVINWLSRRQGPSAALRAVLLGNAVYVFVEAAVLVIGVFAGVGSAPAWGGVILDLLLGVGFVYFYARAGSAS